MGNTSTDITNLAVYIPFLKANEENIEKNIQELKKQEWFQKFLLNEDYKELINRNQKVRQIIGKFNNRKLQKERYSERCQVKLYEIVLKISYTYN